MTSNNRIKLPAVLVVIILGLIVVAGCRQKSAAGVKYQCPMHPTYISDRPGDCPICGMRLVPIETKTAPTVAPLYHCPMHPEITSDKPGKCSLCGMDLVPSNPQQARSAAAGMAKPAAAAPAGDAAATGERKILFYRNPMNAESHSSVPMKDEMGMDYVPVYAEAAASTGPIVAGRAPVKLEAEGVRLAGIQSTKALQERLTYTIRTVGQITADESRIRHVHTKIEGYIEKLYINFTGQYVHENDPILSIYSPELLSSQEEYVRAMENSERFKNSSLPEVRKGGEDLLQAARRKLELFDVPASFLTNLAKTRKPQRTVAMMAPTSGYVTSKQIFEGNQVMPGMELFTITDLSRIWVEAEFYEFEARQLKLGQKAALSLPYDPSLKLEGVLSYIYPVLNADSRTLKVRFELDNAKMILKPAMFANVELEVDAGDSVTIPDSAILDSGMRQVVFVETEPNAYEPRQVTVGSRSGGKAQILSGVKAGESVVTKANFLLDSESRLRAAIADVVSDTPQADPSASR